MCHSSLTLPFSSVHLSNDSEKAVPSHRCLSYRPPPKEKNQQCLSVTVVIPEIQVHIVRAGSDCYEKRASDEAQSPTMCYSEMNREVSGGIHGLCIPKVYIRVELQV